MRPGSSPRGRGKPEHPLLWGLRAGLIPAWAGKTRARACVVLSRRAHPRVGGENTNVRKGLNALAGSSPRGRGKRDDRSVLAAAHGLIPAWAGKTPRPARDREQVSGSSPRGRGKRALDLPVEIGNRLIPAWAGKTPGLRRPPPGHRAHPRVGGENREVGEQRGRFGGSSPRGRGKHQDRSSSTFSSWAHPRVGGENGLDARRWPWDQGSSPRGRGKRIGHDAARAADGLIPAWAGKTEYPATGGQPRPAHPRVGGENIH